MKRISIVKNFKIWITISIVFIVLGMWSFAEHHRLSIEFTGGIDTTITGQHNIDEEKLE